MEWPFRLSQDAARNNAQFALLGQAGPGVGGSRLEYGHSRELANMILRRICNSHGTNALYTFANSTSNGVDPQTQTTVAEHAQQEELCRGARVW